MQDDFVPPAPTPLSPKRLPRLFPAAPLADPPRRRLPLAGPPRDVDRAWRPMYAVWEITLRCDLACHHCGSRAGRARPDELTTAECLDLVRQMAELGVKEVTLIGGEAYLRDDWTEIARAVVQAGMVCTITTGARGLTRERVQQAKAVGVRTFSVSLDGLEATHDRLRGVPGSFRAARDGITFVREAGLDAQVNTQIGRLNFDELPALFEILLAEKVRVWQVQITVAMGRAADNPEILLEPFQMMDLLPLLASFQERGNPRGLRIWPANNIGYYGPTEHVMRPFGPFGGCGAGRTLLGLEANGDIKGCPSLPTADYVGGNIRDHSLREIWEQTAPLRFTRERTVDDLWGYCRTCYYGETCLAGCSWTTHVLFGKPGNNPYCMHRATELAREGKRERLVQRDQATGRPFDHGHFDIVVEDWPADELAARQKTPLNRALAPTPPDPSRASSLPPFLPLPSGDHHALFTLPGLQTTHQHHRERLPLLWLRHGGAQTGRAPPRRPPQPRRHLRLLGHPRRDSLRR